MRILVFGAGALGSLLGAFLAGKNEVTLVGRAPHVDAIRRDGLVVEGARRIHVRPVARTSVSAEDRPELVVVATKAYDTGAAIEALKPVLPPGAILLTVQNGIGPYDDLKLAFPGHVVLAAAVVAGAYLEGPGRVRFAGAGETLLGGTPQELAAAGRVGRLLRESGLNALGVPDIRGPLWQKAIVNAAFNPLSALSGKRNGELVADLATAARMRRLADEGARVARAARVALPERDPWTAIERVAAATPGNKTSMLQDIERGHRTEIDAINGAIVALGKKVGVPTPENEAVVQELKEREAAVLRRASRPASR